MGDHYQLEYSFEICHHVDATYHAYMAGLILIDPASYVDWRRHLVLHQITLTQWISLLMLQIIGIHIGQVDVFWHVSGCTSSDVITLCVVAGFVWNFGDPHQLEYILLTYATKFMLYTAWQSCRSRDTIYFNVNPKNIVHKNILTLLYNTAKQDYRQNSHLRRF